ncbi:hypothetical protein FLJU110815_19645 [Flavobacterium jumunjinense]
MCNYNQIRRKLSLENKKINIQEDWKIYKNEFVDLEPNNSYPIDDIWHYFQEDILHANYKDFFIDLGFYGEYLDNRKGFFRLIVAKGGFGKGELYEKFLSRSTDEIKEKIEFYFNLILSKSVENISGLKYDNEEHVDEYDIYSAVNNIFIKLSDEDFEKLSTSQ